MCSLSFPARLKFPASHHLVSGVYEQAISQALSRGAGREQPWDHSLRSYHITRANTGSALFKTIPSLTLVESHLPFSLRPPSDPTGRTLQGQTAEDRRLGKLLAIQWKHGSISLSSPRTKPAFAVLSEIQEISIAVYWTLNLDKVAYFQVLN